MSMYNEFEYGSPGETEQLKQEIQKLKADRDVLLSCVKFYADGNNWETQEIIIDPDWLARQALKAIGEIK